MKSCEVSVIGCGFFGLRIALFFAKKGKNVNIFEAESDAFTHASSINQARVHNGYHYPRSLSTALSSHNHYKKFCDEYSQAISGDSKNIYAIARKNSYISSRQFESFCNRVDIPLEKTPNHIHNLFSTDLIEESYFVDEVEFDSNILKKKLLLELSKFNNVKLFFNCRVGKVLVEDNFVYTYTNNSRYKSEMVFNTTYAGINTLLRGSGLNAIDFKLELTELVLIKIPDEFNNLGVTVMDGQYFSTIYHPNSKCHSLTHVRYTPHIKWYEKDCHANPYRISKGSCKSKYAHMINDAKRYIPILGKATYLESRYAVKVVPARNELNDGRPIVIKEHYTNNDGTVFVSVLGSKIDTIYDLENYLEKY